jgi:hypothetical protein
MGPAIRIPGVTAEDKVEWLRAVVRGGQPVVLTVGGDAVIIDVESANAIVQVYDRLNEEHREDLMEGTVGRTAQLAWDVVAAQKNRTH